MVNRERLWSGIAAFVFSLGGLSSNAGADGALVAADTSNGPILIVTTNRDTRQQATEAALAACRERAGSACRLFYNFDDMCITYTTSQSSFWHALHRPPKRNSDADNAVELCNKRRQNAAHSCAPAITACDTPYYQQCLQKADLKACRAAAAVFLQDPNRKEIEAQIDRLERMQAERPKQTATLPPYASTNPNNANPSPGTYTTARLSGFTTSPEHQWTVDLTAACVFFVLGLLWVWAVNFGDSLLLRHNPDHNTGIGSDTRTRRALTLSPAMGVMAMVPYHGGLSFMSWPSILIMDPLFRGQPVLGVLVGLPLTLAIMAVGLWVIVGGIYGWLAVIHPRNVQRLYVAIRFLASRHPIESPITRSIATGKPIDGDALADAMEVYDETNAPAPRRSWFQVLRARKVAKSAAATADLHEAQRDAYLAAERLVRVRGEERAAKEALKAAERELEKRKRSP